MTPDPWPDRPLAREWPPDPWPASGRPTAFGWTAAGARVAVVFEAMSEDPKIVYPMSAYPVPPKRTRRERKR